MKLARVPRENTFDSTLAFLREGYLFGSNRFRRFGSDIFVTRLMLRQVALMRGRDATEQFYRKDRFTRRGAVPRTALTLLQDFSSVQTLDREQHRHRKAMFMAMMDRTSIDRARRIFVEEWRLAVQGWPGQRIVLHEETSAILTRTALRWCGVDPDRARPEQRGAEFSAMIAAAGSIGLANLRAQLLRSRAERWARMIVKQVRDGSRQAQAQTPVATIAFHQEADGKLLPIDSAAVELLNLLRPIVAIGRFIVFAALALHDHVGEPDHAASWTEDQRQAFVNEVRRFYPFFPMIGGRALEAFRWRGHHFSEGSWVLLDLYGTNHDPLVWEEPEKFRVDRFADGVDDPLVPIPQGGGVFATGHRCAGEWLTIALVSEAVRLMTSELAYEIPEQDLTVPLNQFPTLPRSGFEMQVR